jgi:hypothetical protein
MEKTKMANTTKHVNATWDQLVRALETSKAPVIQDFMRWDGLMLRDLLDEETRNEKQHRRGNVGRPYPVGPSIGAKITLLANVARGAGLASEPLGSEFIAYRKSAVMAQVVGYHLRGDLGPAFLASASALDYAKLMNAGQ